MHQKKYPDHQTINHNMIMAIYLCDQAIFIPPHIFYILSIVAEGGGGGWVPCIRGVALRKTPPSSNICKNLGGVFLRAKPVDPPSLQVEPLTVPSIPFMAQGAVVWGQALAYPWVVCALVVTYDDRGAA